MSGSPGKSGSGGKNDNAKSVMARLAEREKRVRSGAEVWRLLLYRLGGQEQGKLVSLWKNWDYIMGEEVAALGRPCGHKEYAGNRTLHIGADDSMALQELSLRGPEILERANAALGSEFFTEVKVSLLQGQTGLARESTPVAHLSPARPAFEGPPIGGLIGKLSPDSPITRCYETLVKLAKKR